MNNSHEAIVENMPACILDVAVMRRESFAVYFTWRNYLFRIVCISRYLVPITRSVCCCCCALAGGGGFWADGGEGGLG